MFIVNIHLSNWPCLIQTQQEESAQYYMCPTDARKLLDYLRHSWNDFLKRKTLEKRLTTISSTWTFFWLSHVQHLFISSLMDAFQAFIDWRSHPVKTCRSFPLFITVDSLAATCIYLRPCADTQLTLFVHRQTIKVSSLSYFCSFFAYLFKCFLLRHLVWRYSPQNHLQFINRGISIFLCKG